MRTPLRHRLSWLLIVVLVRAAGALAAPPSPSPEALEHAAWRLREAAGKARLATKLLAAEKEADPAQFLYDVRHYDLDLVLDEAAHRLDGVVTVTATVTGDSLVDLVLDLNDAKETVSAVTVWGQPVTWIHTAGRLTVHLDRTYLAGETVRATITYGGDPSGEYFGWSTYAGQPMIWTLSEPFGARDWWPCKDLNTDKPDSLDLRATVASPLIVASNGLRQADTDNGDGTHTVWWKCRYPITTYLVSLAVYPYQTWTDWYTPQDGGDPMPLEFYVFPDHYSSLLPNYEKTASMIDAFAQVFGEYPFVDEKYGHAEVTFPWAGGMEHQTMTSLSGGWWEFVIAHELSHQWWGDDITCADFHHIWLNEGFATWCEAYWREVNEGWSGYHDEMMAAAYKGPGTIFVEDTSGGIWEIFDGNLSYNKASWVVHMLRGMMGDADFFAGLRLYRQQYGYGSATTEQFRDVMEAASGLELDDFFQQWIYGEYYPVYHWSWQTIDHAGEQEVQVWISQEQTGTGLFTMLVPLRVTTTAGVIDTLVANSYRLQGYLIPCAGTVLSVELDPDDWILCDRFQTTITGVDTPPAARIVLEPNRPNPFNPRTVIPYRLAGPGRVELTIYDLAGRLVRTLVEGSRAAGRWEAVWQGRDDGGREVPSGTYLVRLRAGGEVATRRVVLAR